MGLCQCMISGVRDIRNEQIFNKLSLSFNSLLFGIFGILFLHVRIMKRASSDQHFNKTRLHVKFYTISVMHTNVRGMHF